MLGLLNGRPPCRPIRELMPMVDPDGYVEPQPNRHSMPWRLISASVTHRVSEGEVAEIPAARSRVTKRGTVL